MGIFGITNNKTKKKKDTDIVLLEQISTFKEFYSASKYDECSALFSCLYAQMDKWIYTSEAYDILEKMISLSYRLGDKEHAYEYMALLAIPYSSKDCVKNYLFSIIELTYSAKDFEICKGFIRALYQVSDGAYFCDEVNKKYLSLVGIEDSRTFEDYAEDY